MTYINKAQQLWIMIMELTVNEVQKWIFTVCWQKYKSKY